MFLKKRRSGQSATIEVRQKKDIWDSLKRKASRKVATETIKSPSHRRLTKEKTPQKGGNISTLVKVGGTKQAPLPRRRNSSIARIEAMKRRNARAEMKEEMKQQKKKKKKKKYRYDDNATLTLNEVPLE